MPVQLQIVPRVKIPDYLVGEVQAKMAYVDEAVVKALVAPGGERITLDLRAPVEGPKSDELEAKVQRVVAAMVQGAFRPKVQILEDVLATIPIGMLEEMPCPHCARRRLRGFPAGGIECDLGRAR